MASQEVVYEIDGAEIAVCLAGDRSKPALLLIHGFPSSSASFRNVIDTLARDCFVITPDLPGFGKSAPIEHPTFSRFADLMEGLLAQLGVESFHLYLHDYGAAVALHLATRAPRRIRSLIVQNANAHATGMGPQWSATQAYWKDPTPQREAEATAHLTFEGIRDQYVGGVPEDIATQIEARLWEEDWRSMSLPGRLETQRALVLDYRSHFARFRILQNLGRSCAYTRADRRSLTCLHMAPQLGGILPARELFVFGEWSFTYTRINPTRNHMHR